MRILVLEDEPELLERITKKLQDGGYSVEWARSAGDALLQFVRDNPIDGAIVDLGLEDSKYTGMGFIKRCRKEGLYFPVLVVTGKPIELAKEEESRILGGSPLDYADDYLEKRLGEGYLWEVCDRLRNLITPRRVFNCPPYKFDQLENEFYRDDVLLDLRPRDKQVLAQLMRHAGRTVFHKKIYDLTHGDDGDELTPDDDLTERQRNLNQQCIGRLRKALDPDGKLKPIRTEAGDGYSFQVPLPPRPRFYKSDQALVVCQYHLDIVNNDLIIKGDNARQINLSSLECQLLEVLMRRAGVMCSRVLIHERVYGHNDMTPLAELDKDIRLLREKVNNGKPDPIRHRDNTGYYWFSCSEP